VSITIRIVLLASATVLCSVAAAFAQNVAPQPSNGALFGAADARQGRHTLDFEWSTAQGYDSNVPEELQPIAPTETLASGSSTMFLGHMTYRWRGSRVQVEGTSESVFRQYHELEDFSPFSYSGGIGVSAQLDGRTTLRGYQSAAYSPSYLFGLFPDVKTSSVGQAASVAPDYAVSDSSSYSYHSTATLTRELSRRNQISVSGEFQYTDFLNEPALQRDLDSTSLGVAFSRAVSPNAAIHLGYRYRTGTFGYASSALPQFGVSATEHGVDVGLEYARPLSAVRRMSFVFNIGSAVMDAPIPAVQQSSDTRLYRVYGDVAASWNLSRSWTTRATYRRGLEYIPDLTQPVFVEGFTAEIGGLLTRRLDVVASAMFANGASVVTRDATSFNTSSVDTRVRFAITSTLAVYGEYIYYLYDFQDPRLLAPGIPPGFERNSIRAGLTLWVRALRR
jgi:opacity protein-like surface antigen